MLSLFNKRMFVFSYIVKKIVLNLTIRTDRPNVVRMVLNTARSEIGYYSNGTDLKSLIVKPNTIISLLHNQIVENALKTKKIP